MEPKESKIRTLSDIRKRSNENARKAYLPLEQRVLELEADMIRVIDSLSEMDGIIDYQSRIINSMIRAMVHLKKSNK